MRLDKIIHNHINNLDKEYDLSDITSDELWELDILLEKAGNIWDGKQYQTTNFNKLSKLEQERIHEIWGKAKTKKYIQNRKSTEAQ